MRKRQEFKDRLNQNLVEHMTFTDPETLVTINSTVTPSAQDSIDLAVIKSRAWDDLQDVLKMLENSDDEDQPFLEQLAESYTEQINLINHLLESKHDHTTD